MDITDILKPSAVRVVGNLSSKKRLFQDLGELASSAYGVDASRSVEALQEREALGPTGVGQGVALPHARIDSVEEVLGMFLRIERPLEFDSVDRQPVDLVFALFAPQDAGVDHLKALALVSRTLRDQAICTKLRANTDAAILHAILTEGPATQAA
jgi:PTS system nitrogen regulatory IIA component